VQLLRSDLQKAFRTNVTVENGVTRWVYWFQDPNVAHFVENHNPERSVVIHIVVEPVRPCFCFLFGVGRQRHNEINTRVPPQYEWMSRMQENPIHAPYHRRPAHGGPGLVGNESIFTKPWTMPKPDWDTGPHLGHCQYRYPLGAVVPCSPGKLTGPKANRLYPVYEMNPQTLKPFASIAQLRNAKIANFLNLSSWMPHTIHVRSSDVQSVRFFLLRACRRINWLRARARVNSCVASTRLFQTWWTSLVCRRAKFAGTENTARPTRSELRCGSNPHRTFGTCQRHRFRRTSSAGSLAVLTGTPKACWGFTRARIR